MRRVLTAIVAVAFAIAAKSPGSSAQAPASNRTLFEGAGLILGDGSAAIENSAFLVENGQFTKVGRKGEIAAPAGTVRVDLG
jgi:imidazolonepropionase-like amidohydrolase